MECSCEMEEKYLRKLDEHWRHDTEKRRIRSPQSPKAPENNPNVIHKLLLQYQIIKHIIRNTMYSTHHPSGPSIIDVGIGWLLLKLINPFIAFFYYSFLSLLSQYCSFCPLKCLSVWLASTWFSFLLFLWGWGVGCGGLWLWALSMQIAWGNFQTS